MAEREEEKEKKKIQGGEELCLPLGFRFMPKDEELITYYLLPKLQGRQHVPNDRIIEDNVYTCHPNQLIGTYVRTPPLLLVYCLTHDSNCTYSVALASTHSLSLPKFKLQRKPRFHSLSL